MSKIISPRLPEERLITRIEELERKLEEIRTKQITGSDVLAVETGVTALSSKYDLVWDGASGYYDIGLSITVTPDVASTAIIVAVCSWDGDGDACNDDTCDARLVVDGSPETDLNIYLLEDGNSKATTGTAYGVSLTAASHTIKIQARNLSASRGALTTDSTLSYWLYKT